MTASTHQKFDLAAALKGQQWERCKGELRALVALQGSYHRDWGGPDKGAAIEDRREKAGRAVEAFIREFQDEGYAE